MIELTAMRIHAQTSNHSISGHYLLCHVFAVNERIVDGDNFHLRMHHRAAQNKATNTAKTVNADLYSFLTSPSADSKVLIGGRGGLKEGSDGIDLPGRAAAGSMDGKGPSSHGAFHCLNHL